MTVESKQAMAPKGKAKVLTALPPRRVSTHRHQWDSVHYGDRDSVVRSAHNSSTTEEIFCTIIMRLPVGSIDHDDAVRILVHLSWVLKHLLHSYISQYATHFSPTSSVILSAQRWNLSVVVIVGPVLFGHNRQVAGHFVLD